jgi:hypothetical protein
MNRVFAILALPVLLIGCGGPEPDASVTTDEEAQKACPLFIPYCPQECKLVGKCPPKCECPKNHTLCGQNVCNPQQTCCSGMPFQTPTCIDGTICPISRLKYKTDVKYLGDKELHKTRDELMRYRLAKWRYKDQLDDSKEHLGFIIDDVAPSPSVNANGETVDLYGYTSMAVAALQAQAQEIDALKKEVAALKHQIAKH